MLVAERAGYGEIMLNGRLRSALASLNPDLPPDALEDALRRLTRPAGATLGARNRDFHRMLVAGVTVEYADEDGRVHGGQVRLHDFDPRGNDWLAGNQFTVVENKHERRPEIVLLVNGLPLAVIDLKNPADEDATARTAFQQLQTYKLKAAPGATRRGGPPAAVTAAATAPLPACGPAPPSRIWGQPHGRDECGLWIQ